MQHHFNHRKMVQFREAQHLSRYALAQRTGLSQTTIRYLETEYEVDPRLSTVKLVAKALGIPANQLIDFNDHA